MPSRAVQYGAFFLAVAALWLYCLWTLNYFPSKVQFFVQIFPLWLCIFVGSLSLWNIGLHLISFADCLDAHQELQREIAMAKKDLTSKGLKL